MFDGFTRREVFGTPLEFTVSLVVLFGSPGLMLYGLDQFPSLDPNDRRMFIVPLTVLVVSWALCMVYRRKLMPWGDKALAPGLMWVATFAIASLPMMASVGVILITNGMLDRSPPGEVRTAIVRLSNRNRVTVASAQWPGLRIQVDLTRSEFEDVERGDSLRLLVGPGALGIPWIAQHSLINATAP